MAKDLAGGGDLSPEDEVIVEARARGLSHREVGGLIHRSERTARRRAADRYVAEAIRRRRTETAEEAVGLLGALLGDAIGTLGAGLGDERPADRLRAANSIITLFLRLRDQVEVDADLAEAREVLRRHALLDERSGA